MVQVSCIYPSVLQTGVGGFSNISVLFSQHFPEGATVVWWQGLLKDSGSILAKDSGQERIRTMHPELSGMFPSSAKFSVVLGA